MNSAATYLPMTASEMHQLGWQECDIILVSGDAYVDHPSFGTAIIGRYLENCGYKVGIIAQPDCQKDSDFMVLGAPKLYFGVSAGNLDSMLNHYTAMKKIRSSDAYSPDGKTGLRPDRASIVYTQILKRLYKQIPVVLGGVEASMRRIPHYDYWSDKIRNSVLLDAKADLLVYGMGEKAISEISARLSQKQDISQLNDIEGTVCTVAKANPEGILLPSLENCKNPTGFYTMSKLFHNNYRNHIIYQPFAGRFLKHNPPAQALSQSEMDAIYALPYQRLPHPVYGKAVIPAFVQIQLSITSHRGCFGGCRFCTIGYHQGKQIQSRSPESIRAEIAHVARLPYYKKTISDVGGPSANMYGMQCKENRERSCERDSCLFPTLCPLLERSHVPQLKMLQKVREMPQVKHVFIASGIRFDLSSTEDEYIEQLALYYSGGHLKLAPEHIQPNVLRAMGKPQMPVYEAFCNRFRRFRQQYQKNQQIIPYLIVGHPGSGLQEGLELALHLFYNKIQLEQIQEFTPTPMTLSTCMYFTGLDWESGKPIHIPKGREIRLQKALAQWFMPDNKKYVMEALKLLKRMDLMQVFYPQKR
jgi:uncharacterized radical SAM protein YgiQ